MNNLDWRRILLTSLLIGLLAGAVPLIWGATLLATTMPVAMMFTTYLIVPRAQTSRFLNGMVASLLTAVVALLVFFAVEFMTADPAAARANLMTTLTSMPMLIVVISGFGSWFFSWTHNWTEKKKAELDAKRGAASGSAQKRKPYVSRPTKKRYKKKK